VKSIESTAGFVVNTNGSPVASLESLAAAQAARSAAIGRRHQAQTQDTVASLRDKYAMPVFGRVSPWSLVEMLAQCIDPTDQRLYAASQQVHVLQMLEAMENENAATEEFVLAALVHDLGKVLLLTDEAPENVVCMNTPIGSPAAGAGFANCVFQWNHDEFAWSRLKDHLPEGVAWLVRYHSVLPAHWAHLMDERDRDFAQRYLRPFSRYDHGTKSPFFLPRKRIDFYRPVIEKWLPATMVW
jgi:predicted HD phosphohydrolase